MNKCYILLVTCAATRAVHLELAADQNQEYIQLAWRRFIARRGISRLFISDNFKSFKTEYSPIPNNLGGGGGGIFHFFRFFANLIIHLLTPPPPTY